MDRGVSGAKVNEGLGKMDGGAKSSRKPGKPGAFVMRETTDRN
jgi:hypothetical protein